ncbi:uncharacterized protein LOC121731518 [Aricia agestis]|uniref:uncharacterized protein LOC121731518 n=1 Tax=Aricia agestis TaxID=91739 RepID=UPI001C202828|nr:uncharacterized protein LOC121731518 [Aricia agestis]
MEVSAAIKSRTNRSREWERQRRLKFNDAISKLGEIVKAINKANSNIADDTDDNIQYAKIEIVQKAITCLNNCAQEKTQLKAEILALEVKLQAIEKQKLDKRDVSLQVAIGVTKRGSRSKYMKVVMLQKDKQNNPKEKIIKPTPKAKIEKIIQPTPKLPKLLPLSNIKKENTFVMLPAAPYIFPQRSVLFPTVQPTIVLVDANVQPMSKPGTIPIINRTANDITRTTMVNVLPISAYSRPLSASKTKKSNVKTKTGIAKKPTKKKTNDEASEDTDKTESSSTTATSKENEKVETEKINTTKSNGASENIESDNMKEKEKTLQNTNLEEERTCNDTNSNKMCKKSNDSAVKASTDDSKEIKRDTLSAKIDPPKETEKELASQTQPVPKVSEKPSDPATNAINDKCNKIESEKICDIRSKEKIQSILDPTICESVVETGNARLELAEEFLAASPTAAFLMSFPLVSGNRADSPAEEPQSNAVPNISKESNQQSENSNRTLQFFDKNQASESKEKASAKTQMSNNNVNKNLEQQKYTEIKQQTPSKSSVTSTANVCNENPFLNLPIPTVASSNSTLPDTSTFNLDFDCNLSKPIPATTSVSASNSNIFYKSDTFTNVKNTIYSTSNITSGHEFNSLGLYPCAVESYTNKNKTDCHNSEDNIMKMNSSRLTYDIDLGWSHKGFDFVNNCTTASNTLHKDNILTSVSTPYSTSYNPFNPDFHVPLVPNSNKKSISSSKFTTFPETITSFYSQNSTLWPEDIPNIYSHSNVTKNFTMKQQNYVPVENMQPVVNQKTHVTKQYDNKQITDQANSENVLKTPTLLGQQIPEKFTKKSPSKMHINWMTSEVRTMQNDCNQSQAEIKDTFKLPYTQQNQPKKQVPTDTNYFPINMHHFPTQSNPDESHVWPTPRPAGTAEVTIEPPPINLPTLVGDLALGPHDRKKNDLLNKGGPHADLQICNNFFSVTQLMNRSSDIIARPNGAPIEPPKPPNLPKQNQTHAINDNNRKPMPTRLENQAQVPYIFNENKSSNTFDSMPQFTQSKSKTSKTDKNSKNQKNNYSAEALIRGGTCSQKHQDTKYSVGAQKYNDYNTSHDPGVAQVSHFPPIIDYADNNFASQQFSGTTLYNTTTNSISNSFYTNFMPSGGNLMTSNYAGGHFTSEFVDYSNQAAECNYTNHKYDAKLRNNAPTYHQEKELPTYKSSRRESAAKHKLECSKKEGNAKKYQSKRAKINTDVEDWNDPSHALWQKNNSAKRHPNVMAEESAFPNYVGNQMSAQYQPDYFNSHLVSSNAQNMGPNGERALSSFPVSSSRANFNLSALFPEITTKVQ